jgi:hypothetical protein
VNPQDEEQQRRLVQIARQEHGELLVDAIYYPELGQLTAILVGNERVVYDAAGHRVDSTKGDTFRWNGPAWLAALYLKVREPRRSRRAVATDETDPTSS